MSSTNCTWSILEYLNPYQSYSQSKCFLNIYYWLIGITIFELIFFGWHEDTKLIFLSLKTIESPVRLGSKFNFFFGLCWKIVFQCNESNLRYILLIARHITDVLCLDWKWNNIWFSDAETAGFLFSNWTTR